MAEALRVNDWLTIPGADLEWTAVRAGGPGGQNVNKVASKVELRFDLEGCQVLDPGTRTRLRTLAAQRLDATGRVLVTSRRTRDQARNLDDARSKLRALILRALEPPVPRRPTRPSAAARARRLVDKRHTGAKKRARRVDPNATDD